MAATSTPAEEGFAHLPGCIPHPGFEPEHTAAYLAKAAPELASASEANLAAWSAQILRRAAEHGLECVLEEHVLDLMLMSYVKPAFLDAQMAVWGRAAPQADSGRGRSETATVQPRAVYHRGFGLPPEEEDDGERVELPGVLEASGAPVEIYKNQKFANWGDTVNNAIAYTCYPLTSSGVQTIVQYFKDKDARIRCAGSRHSWSDVFNTPSRGATTEVLICTMQKDAALPTEYGKVDENVRENTDLNEIKILTPTGENGRESARIRLGGAVTSEFFRRWALSEDRDAGPLKWFRGMLAWMCRGDAPGEPKGGQWKWMLRALPILVSVTSPGMTQVICHGAGITHQSVSDLVVRMEIINCRGDRQVIEDPELLRAASGSFGLLGVIISQDFVVDPLRLARFAPKKRPVLLSVPPLQREDVPKSSPFNYDDYSEEEYATAVKEFETDAARFYNEFFWFPLQKKCWINCWDTAMPDGSRPQYPNEEQVHADNLQATFAASIESREWYNNVSFPPKLQTILPAAAAMLVLPNESDYPKGLDFIPSNVPDALHFRRGIHRMPVRDTELSIEVPALPRGDPSEPIRPDLTVVRQAWWAAISPVYEAIETGKSEDEKYPMRTMLEMRILGGSDVLLSSQFGNDFTCMIEVLTNTIVSDEVWSAFINEVVMRWKTLEEVKNRDLRVKFHWGKEWPTEVDGVKTGDYAREVYKNEVPIFKESLEKIGASAATPYSLKDTLAKFGNDTIVNVLEL